MQSPRPAWHLAVVLAAAVTVMHAPVLVGGQTWADPAYLTEVIPARVAAADAVARGEVPAWWPLSGLGLPLAAAPQHGALYPPHWLAALAPDHALAILDLILIAHVWAAAFGVALWARRLDADDLGAVAAGAAFAACGVSGVGTAAAVGIAYLPWIGYVADRLGMTAAPRARTRAAVILALLLGAQALTGQIALVAGAAVLTIAVAASRARQREVAIGWALLAVAGGAMIGAVQLVPAWLHLGGDIAGVADAAAPAWLGILAPSGPGATAPFVGLAVISLALVAALAGERGAGAAALGVAALGVLAAMAWPRTGLPGEPWLLVAPAVAAVTALAGAGFSFLASQRPDAQVLVAVGAAVVVAAVIALSNPTASAAIAVVAGAAVLVALLASGSWGIAAGAPLAAALLVGHPVAIEHGRPRVPRAALAEPPRLLAAATRTPGERVFRPARLDEDDPDPVRRARIAHDTGAGDVAARFGLATAQTSDPGRRAVEDAVWRAAGVAGGRLFDRFDIRWAVLPDSVTATLGLAVAASHGRWTLADVHPARPRAFVAPHWRSVPDPAAAVAAVFPVTGGGAGLDTVVLVGQGEGGPAQRVPVPACAIARRSDTAVDLDCETSDGGWSVLLDAWAPGWSVTVDGEPRAAVVADALVRAARVSPGRHRVSWRYACPGLASGGALSLAGLALAAVAWIGAAGERRRA